MKSNFLLQFLDFLYVNVHSPVLSTVPTKCIYYTSMSQRFMLI